MGSCDCGSASLVASLALVAGMAEHPHVLGSAVTLRPGYNVRHVYLRDSCVVPVTDITHSTPALTATVAIALAYLLFEGGVLAIRPTSPYRHTYIVPEWCEVSNALLCKS